jgi:hypothetical protein
MIEFLVIAVIGFGVVGIVYWQSWRDKRKWEMALSGQRPPPASDEAGIPPLNVDGLSVDPHNRPVLVLWNDLRPARFYTKGEAIQEIELEFFAGKPRAQAARLFVWRGGSWTQLEYKLADPLARNALMTNGVSTSFRLAGALGRSAVDLLHLLDGAPELLWNSISRFRLGKRSETGERAGSRKQS